METITAILGERWVLIVLIVFVIAIIWGAITDDSTKRRPL
jgi:hypothetical protein